jgi:hypothetical protein
MGYGLVETFEFWEHNVTRFDKGNNSGCLFAQYVNMFLKLEQDSPGYQSWDRSEEDKERYVADYRRAEESIAKNAGKRALAKLK